VVTGVGIYISRENHNRSFCTGKKLENVPGPKLGRAQCKFGPQPPSQSLAESIRKGICLANWRVTRKDKEKKIVSGWEK